MPYKLHHWDYDSDTDTDPGWPRRYLTYDHRTACAECHAPNGALRILQNLFGGPATRCVHHRGRDDDRVTFADNRGWGGAVRGFVRIRNCVSLAIFCCIEP
ncbi:hypothetical protein F5Y10DRAFT_250053 [Nemania abortiva]|nr:hypothetical protein F5Y10DRAFT_250053 [Nemania abortiva]